MQLRSSVALALFAAGLSLASANEVVKADPASFPAHRAQIEKALKSDAYSELTRTRRLEVVAALDRMETVLASTDSVQSLSDGKKTQLFNDQELVNTVLTKAAEDSRTVCRKEVRTGSHRLNQNCRTVAQIRRDHEDAKRLLGAQRVDRLTQPVEPGG